MPHLKRLRLRRVMQKGLQRRNPLRSSRGRSMGQQPLWIRFAVGVLASLVGSGVAGSLLTMDSSTRMNRESGHGSTIQSGEGGNVIVEGDLNGTIGDGSGHHYESSFHHNRISNFFNQITITLEQQINQLLIDQTSQSDQYEIDVDIWVEPPTYTDQRRPTQRVPIQSETILPPGVDSVVVPIHEPFFLTPSPKKREFQSEIERDRECDPDDFKNRTAPNGSRNWFCDENGASY